MRAFLHDEAVSPGLDVAPATTTMTVDDELSEVRPVIVCAIVHGVNLGEDEDSKDAAIRRLMDHRKNSTLPSVEDGTVPPLACTTSPA